jgi:hypothetical protein
LNLRTLSARPAAVCLLLLLALLAIATGCASGSSGHTTTSTSTASTSSSASTSTTTNGGGTTTTLPQMMSDYDRELAKTATIQHNLALYLSDQQASQTDPRMGLFYGLRARTQALTCRKALSTGDLAMADSAMRDIYSTLNIGRDVATGTVAQTLADARAIVATLGAPSDGPDRAATLLDQFIAQLAPLLAEATAITPTTTTSA